MKELNQIKGIIQTEFDRLVRLQKLAEAANYPIIASQICMARIEVEHALVLVNEAIDIQTK